MCNIRTRIPISERNAMPRFSLSLTAPGSSAPSVAAEDRLTQIVRCVEEIHRCESELASDKTGTGAWLGYMDWLEELHYQIHQGEIMNRKEYPMFSGLLKYFPDALMEVAHVSFVGNEQHNPGEPLHWAREKSTDEPDALLRHLKDAGTLDTDGLRHSGKVAWRALALLQKEIEAEQKVAADQK